jgi:Domain of unknown function (DUF4388)
MIEIKGYLSEYSLTEVFQMIEQRKQSGMLKIEVDNDSVKTPLSNHYLWFQGGRVVAVAQNQYQTTLLTLLEQRRWLESGTINSIMSMVQQLDQPLGTYLKYQGLVSAEQLKLLFQSQVIQPVCNLFKLTNARFSFDPHTPQVKAEMTGLNISSTELILLGLRALRDWSHLVSKLPDSTSALRKRIDLPPTYKLDRDEHALWKLADGKLSIHQIASQLEYSLDLTQQIAFRLTSIGLLQEITIVSEAEQAPRSVNQSLAKKPHLTLVDQDNDKPLTGAFLNNLMGFLKKKKVA